MTVALVAYFDVVVNDLIKITKNFNFRNNLTTSLTYEPVPSGNKNLEYVCMSIMLKPTKKMPFSTAPEPLPPIKKIKEEPKQQRVVETKRPVAKQTYREEYKKIEPTIQLESYYYGIVPKDNNNESGVAVPFNVKVNI